ncbi:uncharacterized protein LOC113349988 isoform X1 [Papaver somniferum]|uniref:uncharacterized protein LOC113349988 isoform X1 n=2 Tax=Papaver somniferum TaxID=3469 RepID=UPI000E6FE67B|nr:uncharacterized protein LOC113349988 isoform X1 [Papaver somniferum]
MVTSFALKACTPKVQVGGIALDLVRLSGFHTEQVVLQNSMDDNKEEPVTDLGLSIGPGNQSTHVGSNNNSSAGANAGSSADMIFVTSTPLSELVWSPQKGASLKSADCNLPEKNFSFLCGVASNTLVHSPTQSITAKEAKEYTNVDEEILASSQMEPHLRCKLSEANLVRSPRSTTAGSSGGLEEMTSKMKFTFSNTDAEGVHPGKEEVDMFHQTERAPMPDPGTDIRGSSTSKSDQTKFYLARVEPADRNLNLGAKSTPTEINKAIRSGDSHASDMQGSFSPDVATLKQSKVSDTQNPLVISHASEEERLELAQGIQKDEKCKTNKIQLISPLQNQESTAENDLQLLKDESACDKGGIIASKHAAEEGKDSPCQNGIVLASSTEFPAVDVSPSSSKNPLSQRKDKENVLCDDGISENILKDEDDSHESVESCNSTGMFSAGKRKWNFEKQMIVESKKVKQTHHESPHFGPLQRQDSSFMNWISNMIKGLSKSNSEDTPSLALTMKTHHCNRKSETSAGFQTIFKALYCPSSRVQDDRILTLDSQLGEGSRELDNSSSPSTGEDNGKCKQIILSNDKFDQRISDGEGPSTLPNNPSENISSDQEKWGDGSAKNRNFCSMASNLKKNGVISVSSSPRSDPGSPSEGKENSKLGSVNLSNKAFNDVINRSDSLGNLWITRFSPKVSGLMMGLPKKRQQNLNSPSEGPNNHNKIISNAQNSVVSRKEKNVSESSSKPSMEDTADGRSTKTQNFVINTYGSFGFKRIKSGDLDKSKCKLKNIAKHSQRFKNSEALVSTLTWRLDALRNIILSGAGGSTSHATTICFFCGIKGHKLHDCTRITGSEIEEIYKKAHPFDGKEVSACLCIRCFQLDHWAISCPCSFSRKEYQSGGRKNSSENVDFQCQIAITTSDGNKTRVDAEANVGKNVNSITSGTVILDERTLVEKDHEVSRKKTSKDFVMKGKQTASGSTDNVSKENQIAAFCNFVHRHIPAVPRGTFEAVKRLRLTRTDVLKWMKSPMPFACIDGFFLRLRLRKWDEGLGGTGYFVARINGKPGEGSLGSHKLSLSVDIAGFKCFIENRFVSNHDYTEDELMAWWCATLLGGGKMPPEEDLKMKFEERKKFEF